MIVTQPGAAKPAILVVDDDPAVLRAVEGDVRRRYAEHYRVIRADSGAAALRALEALALRGDAVALILTDQRMPGMTGVELLERSADAAPGAKRMLLTAYADTDVAIRAINEVHLDHYLLKPWDPPEQHLYPVADDLLEDWSAAFRPAAFHGVRVVSDRWSPEAHAIRAFLARHQVPFRWHDVERDPEARRLLAAGGASGDVSATRGEAEAGDPSGPALLASSRSRLPLVIVPDGPTLEAPSVDALAAALGLKTRPARPFYDLVIVGGGPTGLAAAVYGASEGLETLMLEREGPGGQAGESSRIENYLGFPVGLSGADLARRGLAQARRFGAEVLAPQQACRLRTEGPYRVLTLGSGEEVSTHAVVLAMGVSWRTLEAPGVARLGGAGVYYGASPGEARSLAGEDVYVVGGANSAGQAAVAFAEHARTVHVLVRAAALRDSMSRYLADRIATLPNVVVHAHTEVVAAHGATQLEALTLRHAGTRAEETVPARSLFVFIGAEPRTAWLDGVVARDEHGFVLTGPELPGADGAAGGRPRGWPEERAPFALETSVPGVFAAGDVRHDANRRVASAVGEGGMAVSFVHRYLRAIGAHP